MLFQDGKFQWKRLQNLIGLAREGTGGLDLSDTVRDGARVLLLDEKLRRQLLLALTEDNRLHIEVRPYQLLIWILAEVWSLLKGAQFLHRIFLKSFCSPSEIIRFEIHDWIPFDDASACRRFSSSMSSYRMTSIHRRLFSKLSLTCHPCQGSL